MSDLAAWVAQRAAEDDRLYQRYGKRLERDHAGEFVAIGPDGTTLVGADELTLTQLAAERFGPGHFALRRIGDAAEIRWRRGP